MDANVVFFIACVIHASSLVGNSLELVTRVVSDFSGGPNNFSGFDMSYLECNSRGCKFVEAVTNRIAKLGPWELANEEHRKPRSRTKRRIFLPDNRLRIREQSVGRFPFNSAVAIRVNGEVVCSGIALLRPRFFLTAAHCVQPDGKPKDIDVGVLHKYREMVWAKVNNTRLHPVWRKRRASKKNLRLKDYAVLETASTLPVNPMAFGYVGADEEGNELLRVNKTYIYFNAFDNEKHLDDLNMRFCKMRKIKYYRIYSHCDSVPKTAGAGVYLRMRNKKTGGVERKVIAIATGDYGLKANSKFSVALRINSRMFPHICFFVTGSFGGCN